MERVLIALGPGNSLVVVSRIGINADHDLGPGCIAIIPGRFVLADAPGRAIDWIRCMVECIDGSALANLMCSAIASSLSFITKSARQYHCKPGG